jgi:16S rRNA (uracil1498-N3)-methyltransferase
VLRLRSGDKVVVLDGAGNEFHSEVANVQKKSVELSVIKKNHIPAPPCSITLLQGIPKGQIIEDIIEKATELGVTKIVPLLTQRVVTQLDERRAAEKREKWQVVAIEAIKQCGQPWLPTVETPMTPKAYLQRAEKHDLPLVASLQEGSRHASGYFREFVKRETRPVKSVCVWVGPEGDFTPEEMDLIRSSGANPITLGKLVLRCETAATFCLSIINYETQSAYL